MELLLAPLVSFGAVALLVLTVLGRENHELGDRLGPYMTSRPEEQQRQLSQSFLRRVLMPTFLRAPNMAGVVLRGTSRGKLQLLLESAGSPLRLEVFLAIQIAGAATLPLGYLALTLSRGAGLEPIQLLLALALVGLVWLALRRPAAALLLGGFGCAGREAKEAVLPERRGQHLQPARPIAVAHVRRVDAVELREDELRPHVGHAQRQDPVERLDLTKLDPSGCVNVRSCHGHEAAQQER